MFAFKVAVILEEFKKHQPQMLAAMEEIFAAEGTISKQDYDRLDNISIDYAIMEKTDRCVVVPSDFGWSDIGSWKSLYDFLEKDDNNNVLDGDIIVRNTRNCFVLGHDRLIAANRLHDLVVVETPDSIFVSDMENSRDVKSIVSELKSWGRKEYQQHRTVYHPWGIAKLLEQTADYKAFELTVYPGNCFSLPEEDSGTRHFLVIKGKVEISTASRGQALEKAGSFTLADGEPVSIENAGSEDACLIQVITAR
jgi:mannose-6-phosphate isomerase-like protein (cupin superfamily)